MLKSLLGQVVKALTSRDKPRGAMVFGPQGRVEPTFEYAPNPDGEPDPGEVVWTWVSYEDDPAQGKDRPVLLVGRQGHFLLGLQLTSKDHDRDAEQEASVGRHWADVGAGAWDARRRPSEARLDRLLLISPEDVRREGAVLDRGRFDRVLAAARPYLGSAVPARRGPSSP